jgi:hypothetical protein
MPKTLVTQPDDPFVRYIGLTRGQFAIIDSADYEKVQEINWSAYPMKGRFGWYAGCRFRVRSGKFINHGMHRFVLDISPGDPRKVDHKNGNGLDNRRINLRVATPKTNAWNRRKSSANVSGFKGVWCEARSGLYCSSITVHGETTYLGRRKTAVEAARLYDAAALYFFGEFAWINFPEERLSIVPGIPNKQRYTRKATLTYDREFGVSPALPHQLV